MQKRGCSAERLSDPEITTCILRHPAPAAAARSSSRRSSWSTRAAPIGVALLLVLGVAAAAAGDDSSGSSPATCEEKGEKFVDCGLSDSPWSDDEIASCEDDASWSDYYSCQLECDVEASCEDYECCLEICFDGEC